jgi:hypothetical protein
MEAIEGGRPEMSQGAQGEGHDVQANGSFATPTERLVSPWIESRRLPDGTLPEAQLSPGKRSQLVETALNACEGHVKVPGDSRVFVEETGSDYIVTFPVYYSRLFPGPGYYAQVTIDKATGKVTGILGGS